MARRMFSNQIVDSDAFLDMPSSAQNLYFHLGMRADDDGFVGNPRKIQKVVGGSEDDLKILLAKRFILSFESGVIVIKHWLIHNQIRKDRYNETQYLDEKKTLEIKSNNSYTEVRQPLGNHLATQDRIGEGREVEVKEIQSEQSSQEDNFSKEIKEIIDLFGLFNKNNNSWFKNKTQRADIKWLVEKYSLEKVKKAIYLTAFCFKDNFYPSIGTPHELREKWVKMKKFYGSKEIKDRRFIQDFEKYMFDLEKEKYKDKPKVKIESMISGRKISLIMNKEI